jgi:hypothetical protein
MSDATSWSRDQRRIAVRDNQNALSIFAGSKRRLAAAFMVADRFEGHESETDRGWRLGNFYNVNQLKRLIADP